MATIHTTYLGDLRTEATHLQSGTKIITDAPTDNQGRGEAFSPTDLLAESLAGCMLTTMGIFARNNGIDMDGTHCEVTKIMAANPRRVAEVIISKHRNGPTGTIKLAFLKPITKFENLAGYSHSDQY